MNKSIFVGLTLAAIATILVVYNSGLLQDANATTISPSASERANNNLDKHIAAGGNHGEKAQEIKNECGRFCG